jgi:hypothetical protein
MQEQYEARNALTPVSSGVQWPPFWLSEPSTIAKQGPAPGIKIRTGHDRVIRLTDAKTGQWLANVRWRPQGTIHVELASSVQKCLVIEDATQVRSVQ